MHNSPENKVKETDITQEQYNHNGNNNITISHFKDRNRNGVDRRRGKPAWGMT
jgi:hypothetical protein